MSEALDKLVHDVNSKCASLRDAAKLLRSSAPPDAAELLELMVKQADSLAQALREYRAGR